MSWDTKFANLQADLTRLLPPDSSKRLDLDCFSRYRYDCLELFAEQINQTLSIINNSRDRFPMDHFDQMCQDDKPQAWVTERAYVVALTMAILGCIGLAGNIMSCVVIAIYLLKFSGTFVLFLFLSMSDSLVVVMQVIDAYRNFVAVSQYTALDSEAELTVAKVRQRDWSCKIFLYFWHFGLQLSAWLVMALSVDRYASLRHIQVIRSRPFLYRRAWIIVGSILTVLSLLNLPFLLFVKSKVIKTHCGLNHFCIFGELDRFWSTSTESAMKMRTKDADHVVSDSPGVNNVLEAISIREAVESPTARWISLWLSRQHLIVFGIIPYITTFIFNMILIHYLRSCPPNKNAPLPECVDKPETNRIVQSREWNGAGRQLLFCHCLSNMICCRDKFLRTKRKSTTGMPLMILTNNRPDMRWDVSNLNHTNHPDRQNVIAVRVNDSVLPVHMTAQKPERDIMLQANRRLAESITLVHDSSEGGSNRCSLKCNNCFEARSVPCQIVCNTIQVPAVNYQIPNCGNRSGNVTATKPAVHTGTNKGTTSSNSGFWIGQKRTTILLLVVTFTFIGLTLPYHIYVELEHFHKVNKGASTHYDSVHAAEDLCRFLLFLNNCMNFVVYMTGRQFRKGFFLVLRRMRQAALSWITCQSPQTDGRWHRHPPNSHRKDRHRNLVRNKKQACRLILEANRTRPRLRNQVHCISHQQGCPLAMQNASVVLSEHP